MGKKAKSKGKSFAPAGNVSNSTAVETPPGAPFPKEPTIFQAIEVGVDPKLLLRLIQQGEDVNAANVFRCGHLDFWYNHHSEAFIERLVTSLGIGMQGEGNSYRAFGFSFWVFRSAFWKLSA